MSESKTYTLRWNLNGDFIKEKQFDDIEELYEWAVCNLHHACTVEVNVETLLSMDRLHNIGRNLVRKGQLSHWFV